ncbi:hypothetical protein ACJ41O_003918 [Fusarium nematophilum]
MVYLPDEILELVFSHFDRTLPLNPTPRWDPSVDRDDDPPSETQTLASLCLVCRNWRRLAQPSLFHTIDLRDDLCPGKPPMRLIALARALASDPGLGRWVRRIALHEPSSLDPDHDPRRFAAFVRAISRALCPSPENLQRFVPPRELSHWGAVIVLILNAMPGLQILQCTAGSSGGALGSVFRGAAAEATRSARSEGGGRAGARGATIERLTRLLDAPSFPIMKHLKELRLGAFTGKRTSNMSDLEGVLLHPGLETLRLMDLRWTCLEVGRMRWADQRSSIKTLYLRLSYVDHSGLEDMLTRCGNLRSLSIQICETFHGDEDGLGWEPEMSEIDLTEYGRLLTTLGRNLEELHLHTTWHSQRPGRTQLGSLRGMTSLRKLTTNSRDLVGVGEWAFPFDDLPEHTPNLADVVVSYLPRGLETLCLLPRSGKHVVGRLREALLAGQFPRLHIVRLGPLYRHLQSCNIGLDTGRWWEASVEREEATGVVVGSDVAFRWVRSTPEREFRVFN